MTSNADYEGTVPFDYGDGIDRPNYAPTADYERVIAEWQGRVQSFADDMRAQGIHVGLGNPGRCVTCGEPWPCEASHAR